MTLCTSSFLTNYLPILFFLLYIFKGSYLYVTDFQINAVFKFNIELTEKETIIATGILNRPQGLAIDTAGNLLVCDSRNNCIRVSDTNGKILCTIDTTGREDLLMPLDVAILKGGKVAVLDDYGRFRIF